ncbi:hypothetical protein I308_103571 [Cryptococcus tetragattii IND107]|uniref:Secreted protein n=1 Tax=Cryptococcus tetragattii IND107 TaxID=1296105 RepID=A0ABR3BQQ4_9TREE
MRANLLLFVIRDYFASLLLCPASSGFFLAARSHGLRYQKYTRQLAREAAKNKTLSKAWRTSPFPVESQPFPFQDSPKTSRLHYSVFLRSSAPDNILCSRMVQHTTIQK